MCELGEYVYVFGGLSYNRPNQNPYMERINIGAYTRGDHTQEWVIVGPSVCAGRWMFGCTNRKDALVHAISKTEIFIGGGHDWFNSNGDGYIYNAETNKIKKIFSTNCHTKFNGHCGGTGRIGRH